MSYRIAQDFEYAGNDYWRWRAWIEAEPAELDAVTEVVWILHPSFKRTRVAVSDRASGFRLDGAGWGTFRLRAEVATRRGETIAIAHNLRLEYPPQTDAGAPSAPSRGPAGTPEKPGPKVFLSYSGEDSRAAAKLRAGLQRAGLEVLDASQVKSGASMAESLRQMLASSDAVVGLVGEDEASPWVIEELRSAGAADKPSFALLPRGARGTGLPSGVQRFEIDVGSPEAAEIAAMIRRVDAT